MCRYACYSAGSRGLGYGVVVGRASDRREVDEAFTGAASLLGLDAQGPSVSGEIDGFGVWAYNFDDDSSRGLVARVYLEDADLPLGLEVVAWGWYSRMMNLWGWLPFFTTYRKIDCEGGHAKGVYATRTQARDEWLTPDTIQRLCALRSELTTTGFLAGSHYLEQRSAPASDTGHIVERLTRVLDDARQFVR
jgi:hypothetical protein